MTANVAFGIYAGKRLVKNTNLGQKCYPNISVVDFTTHIEPLFNTIIMNASNSGIINFNDPNSVNFFWDGAIEDMRNMLEITFGKCLGDELKVTMRGLKFFELTNHLGNVLTVVTDHKVPVASGGAGANIDYYEPEISSITDYDPFGMQILERSWTASSYRFGFNDMEKDDEVKGAGNSLDFGARIYDSRLGRWMSMDKFTGLYKSLSPFCFGANSPVSVSDKDGNILRDQAGNIIATDNGQVRADYNSQETTDAAGNRIKTTTVLVGRAITIYANDGSPHSAMIVNDVVQTTAITDKNGNSSAPIIRHSNSLGVAEYSESDCHGYTITGAQDQIWVNNEDMLALMKADGDVLNVDENEANAVVFKDAKGNVNHSARREKDGTYSADAGTHKVKKGLTLKGAAGGAFDVGGRAMTDVTKPENVIFAKRKGDTYAKHNYNNQLGGTVTNGVNLISKKLSTADISDETSPFKKAEQDVLKTPSPPDRN
jgi:RHS repeat-associated protein